ncbi:hypothetical protein [Dactylosporangium sp. CA-092794]|uniref:hypothetical protein n=1 Tax=Dactylosporangium sp. CA-092794 TaxID=3239929 RepID=UPI003D8E72FC
MPPRPLCRLALGPALAVLLLAGCATAAPTAAPATGAAAPGTRLLEALAHVADTDATRSAFEFSDVAALGALGGGGWAGIRYAGARRISPKLPLEAGLRIDAAGYAISAGREPRHVIVFAGGQDDATVAAGLRRLGWKPDGDRFLAPPMPMTPAPPNDGGLVPGGQARSSGGDLLVGGQTADLADAVPAGRPTLAVRPVIAALAACLGDVVAARARFAGPGYLAVAATGVRRPDTAGAKPRAVLCAATGSGADAAATAETLRQGFATGRAPTGSVPFTTLYPDATVTVLDGPEHVVRAETTEEAPDTMLSEFGGYGLPGEVGQGEV